MGAYGSPDIAVAGLLEGFPNLVDSAIAQEDIAYGAPVFGVVGQENKAYNFHYDKATVTLSAALVASDTVSITIHGKTFDKVYATSHKATVEALVADINEDADLAKLGIVATITDTTTQLVFVVQAPYSGDAGVSAVSVSSAGAGTATIASVVSSAGKFLGIAVFVQNGGATWGAGTSCWKNKSAVNILRDGRIYVPAVAGVKDKEAAYVITGGSGTKGVFSNTSSDNYDIGGYFRSNVAGGLALLEVRGMK